MCSRHEPRIPFGSDYLSRDNVTCPPRYPLRKGKRCRCRVEPGVFPTIIPDAKVNRSCRFYVSPDLFPFPPPHTPTLQFHLRRAQSRTFSWTGLSELSSRGYQRTWLLLAIWVRFDLFRITCLFESIGFYFVFPLICGDGIIGTSAAYCNMGNGIIISKAINIFQQKNKKSRLRHLGQINGKHPRLCSVGYVQNHTRGIYLPRVLPYRELL